MQESRISFNTATLAKEKGFNWGCNMYYQDSPRAGSFAINNINNSLIDELHKEDPNCVIYYACPTQSLLHKWLREVHKLSVEVGNEYQLKSWNCYIVNQDNDSKPILTKDDEYFSTYEAALEEGLYKALKNDSI